MRIAVLGARGLLGHYVCDEYKDHEVFRVIRQDFDLRCHENVEKIALDGFDWIVNCAGITKSRAHDDPAETILVNSAMPHWLEATGARVLHVSTDCVFDGEKGDYTEDDTARPGDLYGASKLVGELTGPNSITIRTSFIGWELGTKRGFLEWFARLKKVQGYRRAFWSGLSAREVARAISHVIEWATDFSMGTLYHVSGPKISKLDLLLMLRRHLDLDVEIEPVDEPVIDRSLNGSLFRKIFDFQPKSWEEMAAELARTPGVARFTSKDKMECR